MNAESIQTSIESPCSIQLPGQGTMELQCRWIINARSNKTVFVEHGLTGARYVVGDGWRVLDDACIVSEQGAKVCRL